MLYVVLYCQKFFARKNRYCTAPRVPYITRSFTCTLSSVQSTPACARTHAEAHTTQARVTWQKGQGVHYLAGTRPVKVDWLPFNDLLAGAAAAAYFLLSHWTVLEFTRYTFTLLSIFLEYSVRRCISVVPPPSFTPPPFLHWKKPQGWGKTPM